MGIAAKRFEKEFTDSRIPEAMKELEQSTNGATKNVAVHFDWKSFGEDQAAMDNVWSLWKQSIQGVEGVCSDDIGRAAVKKGLKKIMVVNFAKPTPASVTFKGGVLTFSMHFAGGGNSSPGWDQVQKVLEEGLN